MLVLQGCDRAEQCQHCQLLLLSLLVAFSWAWGLR